MGEEKVCAEIFCWIEKAYGVCLGYCEVLSCDSGFDSNDFYIYRRNEFWNILCEKIET